MKRRILHIISGDLWGGAEAQMMLQIHALREEHWDAQVLFFNDSDTRKQYQMFDIPTFVVDEKKGFLQLILGAKEFVQDFAPHLLVVHSYKECVLGAILSKLCRVPFISTFHGAHEVAGTKMKIYAKLHLGLSRRYAAKIITVSKALAMELGFSKLEKLEVIYNVVDAEAYKSGAPLVGGGPKKVAIVWVGRLVPVKRPDIAILAMKELLTTQAFLGTEEPHMYMIGDGPLRGDLMELAGYFGLQRNVHFLGFVQHAGLLIASANILLITSDNEGVPTVLLEAIAGGVPVVTTDVGGIREVLNRCKGHPAAIVPAGNPEQLAGRVAQVLNEASEKQKKWGKNEHSRQRVYPSLRC